MKSSVIHLINIDGQWHRVHVFPISDAEVEGNFDLAQTSRIAEGDFPSQIVPAVYIHVQGRPRLRLSNKVDKTLGYLESLPRTAVCRLTTKRQDAPPDLNFVIQELYENEDVQRRVWDWLTYEAKVRNK